MPQPSYKRDSTALLVDRHIDFLFEVRQCFAMELGYHVALVPDATAAFSHEAIHAHEINARTFANAILATEELFATLPAPATLEEDVK